ncbi:hypothetical protein Aduo_019092 [Ancylostoma duodenale]
MADEIDVAECQNVDNEQDQQQMEVGRGIPKKMDNKNDLLEEDGRGIPKKMDNRNDLLEEDVSVNAKALIDTGSVISMIPGGLLKRAHHAGSGLDEMVTVMEDDDDVQVHDASGNPMKFLMRTALEIKVQGAVRAKTQLYIQQSKDKLVLGTNVSAASVIEVMLHLKKDENTSKGNLDSSIHPKQATEQSKPHDITARAVHRILKPSLYPSS